MQLRIFTEPQQGATYDDLLAVAQRAGETGFDAFFRSDHYRAMGGDGLPGPTDAWLTPAGIARETSRIRLGTLMSAATFRLPGPLAIAVAQVEQMSGGRIGLGIGSGWYEAEHTAYGIPADRRHGRPPHAAAGRAVRAGVQRAVRLRRGQRPPVRRCGGAALARRAAAIGRDVDELREHGAAGSPAQVVDTLGRYADAGATRGYLQVPDVADLDHLDLVAAEVAPQLAP